MDKENDSFKVDGIEIGDPERVPIRSLGGGVKGITFTKLIRDFIRKHRYAEVHRVYENGKRLLVIETSGE